MDGNLTVNAEERKCLLRLYRRSTDPQVRLRAHIILLLAIGCPYEDITTMLFTSPSTISRWKKRFQRDGLDALQDERRGRPVQFLAWWVQTAVCWVTEHSPTEFGFCRSRWACATVACLLWQEHRVKVSAETIRRCLNDENIVWRRPRPVLGPTDPEYEQKLLAIQRLLAELPADETVLFQDEVDINTNPKIGSMWMPLGEQAEVVTPGNNAKRYLAGSLHWRTGRLVVSEPGTARNAELFVRHLDDLRVRFRGYRVIHVICDNAPFHDCKRVNEFLDRWGHRIKIHFLPKYAPETNPIERVWWHLHEQITRNHQCPTIEELIDMVFQWLGYQKYFAIETSIYRQPLAA